MWSLLIVKYLVKDPVEKVALASSNLQQSVDYWNGVLGLEICSQDNSKVVLKFSSDQTELELEDIGKPVLLLSAFLNTL